MTSTDSKGPESETQSQDNDNHAKSKSNDNSAKSERNDPLVKSTIKNDSTLLNSNPTSAQKSAVKCSESDGVICDALEIADQPKGM